MEGSNLNLDLVNTNAFTKFCEILSICSMKFWGKSRAITLEKSWKMMSNNPSLDLVNMNAYINFGENMSICSQDINEILG